MIIFSILHSLVIQPHDNYLKKYLKLWKFIEPVFYEPWNRYYCIQR